MSRIEEIMSSQKDKLEKMTEVKEYYKEILKDFSYIELFDGLKRLTITEKNSEKFKKVPTQFKTALKEAIEELMKEKIKEMDTSDFKEVSDYFAEELQTAKDVINNAQRSILSKESKSKVTSELKDDDNYTRFATAYQDSTINPTGKSLIESDGSQVVSEIASDTIKLINEYKKDIK